MDKDHIPKLLHIQFVNRICNIIITPPSPLPLRHIHKKDFSMFYKGNGCGLLTSSVAADTIATKKGSSRGIKVKQKTPNNGRDRV